MLQGDDASGGPKKGLTLDDLIAAIDRHERNPSNIPKVDTFHFCGERVSEWLERVEQDLVGRSDVVKFQRILQYVLHNYHQEVKKVIDAAQGSWERFKEGMQRKYRLGDGLLTTADLEAMCKEDFTTIGAFVEQRQIRLQRQKRKERDATASGTLGLTRIVTDVLAQLGYATEPVVQRRVVTVVQVKGTEPVIEKAVQEELWEEEEPVPQRLMKVQRKVRNLDQGGQGSGKAQAPQALTATPLNVVAPSSSTGPSQGGAPSYGQWPWPVINAIMPWGSPPLVAGLQASMPPPIYPAAQAQPVAPPPSPAPNSQGSMVGGGNQGRAIKATEGGVEEGGEAGMAEEGNGMVKARGTKARGIKARGTKARGIKAKGIKARDTKEPGKIKEAVEVEDDDDEEEEDERLCREEDQRAEQRARKKGAMGEVESIVRDGPPKRKKYAVRLEEGFDVEKVIDRLLEGHNELMTLKEFLASATRLRVELKGRLSRRLVPNVHLGTILPKEAEWAESGTKMDRKCVACDTVDLVVKGSKCAAMVDTGAEMNIIREADAIKFGLDIDRSDCGILHEASCKAVFCGTALNVLIKVGKVKVRACFFIMPDVDHEILLGRSFLSRTETVIFNKHDGTLILLLCDPACGNYEIITCRNTGPRSVRNRPNPGSFMIEESEGERRRLRAEPEAGERVEAFSLSLSDVGKAMDLVAAHEMADPDAIQALREQVLEFPKVGWSWGRLKQGSQRRYKTVDKKCRPVLVLVREDEEAYYERERGLIRRMRESALAGPCRINEGNEGELIIGEPDFLLPQERALMVELMKKRHRAYAFSDEERGRLDVDKIPMIRIHTVPHEPWNMRGAWYPNPDEEKKVVDYLDGKIRTHVADYSSGPYASPWFCFIKPNGTLRWVQDLERLNVVTVRDAGGLPNADALSESYAGPTALGGVLIQADIEGKERSMRFESQTLCTTERNYSQFKRETLAVLHCLRIFRNNIFRRRFILRVDPTALTYSLRNYVPSDPTVARWLAYIWMFNFELERIPGSKNRADGLSRINWDKQEGEAVENTPPVDGFLDQEEDVRLHINKWSLRVPSCVGYPIWQAPSGYERRTELVLKPFEEEDPWGSKDVQWMMELALASSHSLVEDMRTIEEGPGQVEWHEDLMRGMYLLVNTLLQENLDQSGSLNPAGNVDEVPESQDDEFEEGEIKEAFRAEEYDGIYLELGLLLSCEMRLRDASDRAQRMLQRYLVRDDHLFVRREVGNPRRVVCGRNRQIDIVAALHDGIAGRHRGVQATYAKISELYYWDGMMDMVEKFCRSCVPCQERSCLRQGEPLHPRLEREVGAVVHLDLLFMPLGDQCYNYIFDARNNMSDFVDERAIRSSEEPGGKEIGADRK
ncbi:hypothetical protein CBR_g4142 [Chara braunii]|uniref:RNA-directed DNA polymerase n=1 Tax=Chara braunii TaxID=69332 RepID=A0A388KHG0_CHABU|nr:hypothetical protein CBR_g4142 [Chara braunii]|eukprot:GBG69447.1 hypothetical protein CBR_g4142 [Chara braunii]